MKFKLYDKVRIKGTTGDPRRITGSTGSGRDVLYKLEGGGIFQYTHEDRLELVERYVDDGRGVELKC